MSATADGARLSGLMDAEVIESAGRMFPVTIEHLPRDIAHPRDLADAVARAVRSGAGTASGRHPGFPPRHGGNPPRAGGASRIAARWCCHCTEICRPAEQDRALRPAETRRVVLATSIAETSLTVPGVRIVVDGGWRRTPRLDPATGLTRLTTLRISRAAADQRAGRAGREAPGMAIRVWSPALHRGLATFDRPEILEAELSVAGAGLRRVGHAAGRSGLPRPATRRRARRRRRAAAGTWARSTGRIGSPRAGQAMVRIGAHPRLAAMMQAADDAGQTRPSPPTSRPCWRNATRCVRGRRRPTSRSASTPSATAMRRPIAGALARIRQASRQYRRRLHVPAETAAEGDAGALLAAAFPDRIAQRRGEPGSFRLSGGGGARLGVTDPLAKAGSAGGRFDRTEGILPHPPCRAAGPGCPA